MTNDRWSHKTHHSVQLPLFLGWTCNPHPNTALIKLTEGQHAQIREDTTGTCLSLSKYGMLSLDASLTTPVAETPQQHRVLVIIAWEDVFCCTWDCQMCAKGCTVLHVIFKKSYISDRRKAAVCLMLSLSGPKDESASYALSNPELFIVPDRQGSWFTVEQQVNCIIACKLV